MKRLVLFVFVLTCCCEKRETQTIIEGTCHELKGEMIYLKTNNHFDFLNENFQLDSVLVDSFGKFKFKISLKEPLLVQINKYHNVLPGTLYEFKNTPQDYQYLLCKNFLAYHPTLYLEPGKKYNIKYWKDDGEYDAVKYDDFNQNLLRKYYYDSDYYPAVRFNRQIRDIDIDSAWENLTKIKTRLLSKYGLTEKQPINSFNHYLRTEIILGASNWFFNWFDARELVDFKNPIYKKALDVYSSEEWNKSSLHYFKLTERLVNTKLSYKYNSYRFYYEPSLEKLLIAKKYVGSNIRGQYSSNIERLLD